MSKIKIRKKCTIASYSGSLIQQGYGEEINKSYNIWILAGPGCNTHERRIIPNDYGFVNIIVAHGENWVDRLSNVYLA